MKTFKEFVEPIASQSTKQNPLAKKIAQQNAKMAMERQKTAQLQTRLARQAASSGVPTQPQL